MRTIAIVIVAMTACGGVSEDRAANQQVNTDGAAAAAGDNAGSTGGNAAPSTGGDPATGGQWASGGTTTGNGGSSGSPGAGTAGTPQTGTGGEAGTPGVVDGGSADGGDLADGPSSFAGCRAPSEPGCATCCYQGRGYCTELSASSGSDWYNVSTAHGTVCPADCARCAPCSISREQQARDLVCRPECDCSRDPGIDPCFTPSGCGCYCVRRASLRTECPELDVCP